MTLYEEIQANLTYIGKPAQNGSGLENPQLATLQSTLDLYQQINNSLINSRENARSARAQSSQNVMQIIPAIQPKNQVSPIPILYLFAGSSAGLILAVVIILMIEHLDDSIKSAGQIEKLLGLPVLGFVPEDKQTKNGLVTLRDPFSSEAESFRALGASLEIIGARKNVRTLMIVNAEPESAKTNIAANLAVIYAQQGKQVILLDGDLKRPHLHSLFGVDNQRGFSELLDEKVDLKSACHIVKDVEGMRLIFGGVAENASTGWLDAEKLSRLLSTLQPQTDLVIVDSPPADAANAQILASKMDAILLVIRAGHTRADSAQAAVKRFQWVGVRLTGAVLTNYTTQYRKINKQFWSWVKTKFQNNGVSSLFERW
jgi:capsular exopolysaccharide synthesis family protein